MAILSNTAEGGTAGTAVTQANSGGASGDAFTEFTSNGTFEYTAAQVMRGSLAYHVANTGTNTIFGWSGQSAMKAAVRFYFRMTAAPTAAVQLFTFRNSVNFNLQVALNTNRTINVSLGAAQGSTTLKTTAALAVDTWYRIEVATEIGTSSTAGKVWMSYFLGNSTTPVETGLANLATDMGTTPIVSIRFGKLNTSGNVDFYYDAIAVDNVNSTFLGPDTALQSASLGADVAAIEPWSPVTMTLTAGGTPTGYVWRQTSGPTVTLTGTGATRSYTAPGLLATTTLTFAAKASYASGDYSVEDFVNHEVLYAPERAIIGGVEVPIEIMQPRVTLPDTWTPTPVVTNYATNPGFETTTAPWASNKPYFSKTNVLSAMGLAAAGAFTGSNGMKLTLGDTTTSPNLNWISYDNPAGSFTTVQAKCTPAAGHTTIPGSWVLAPIQADGTVVPAYLGGSPYGGSFTLTTSWQKISMDLRTGWTTGTYPTMTGTRLFLIFGDADTARGVAKAGDLVYLDLFTDGPYSGLSFDGYYPGTGTPSWDGEYRYDWTGTPYASASTKTLTRKVHYPATITLGTPFTVEGTGYPAGIGISVMEATWGEIIVPATADSSGNWSITMTIPANTDPGLGPVAGSGYLRVGADTGGTIFTDTPTPMTYLDPA